MAGVNYFAIWTTLLRLPDFEVAHVHEDTELKRLSITLISKHSMGVCPDCGAVCDDVKQRRTREGIHDLPMGRNSVELKVRVNQYACGVCERCFTPPLPFLAEGSHATERFLERAAQLIRQSDVLSASRFLGVPERSLDRWYCDYVERQLQAATAAPLKPIRRLGIDELSLKKSTDSSSP